MGRANMSSERRYMQLISFLFRSRDSCPQKGVTSFFVKLKSFQRVDPPRCLIVVALEFGKGETVGN